MRGANAGSTCHHHPHPTYVLASAAWIPTLVLWHADGRFTRLEGAPCADYARPWPRAGGCGRHDMTFAWGKLRDEPHRKRLRCQACDNPDLHVIIQPGANGTLPPGGTRSPRIIARCPKCEAEHSISRPLLRLPAPQRAEAFQALHRGRDWRAEPPML